MKRYNEVYSLSKSISIFNKRLQNSSTKKKLNNKPSKDNNNKIIVTKFNNNVKENIKTNLSKAPKKISHSSSFINSKPNNCNNKVLLAYQIYAKKTIKNNNYQKNIKSPVAQPRNKNIKTSIINNQNPTPVKNIKNIFYSPSCPYTPTISSISNSTTSRPNSSNKSNITVDKDLPSGFNEFIIPSWKIEKNSPTKNKIKKHIEPQEIFRQQMNLLKNNLYKEITKLAKKLAGIEYNKRNQLNDINRLYIKQLKKLYADKEDKFVQMLNKYKYGYGSNNQRIKYLEMYKTKAEIEDNFEFEKEQIKTTYQMNYDLIKQREENEIKKLLDMKIIDKARNKLINILDDI